MSGVTEAAIAPRQRRPWDLPLTIVLLVVYLIVTVLGSASSFFLVFAGDSCGASSICDYDQIGKAVLLALGGVWVAFVLLLILAIVLLVTRRLAFWVPLLGILVAVGIVITAFVLASSAVVPAVGS